MVRDISSYNRALVIIVLGMIAVLWVLANNPELFRSSIFYIVAGSFSILAYFKANWERF